MTQTVSTRSIGIQVQNDDELGNNNASDNEAERINECNIQVSFNEYKTHLNSDMLKRTNASKSILKQKNSSSFFRQNMVEQ